MKVDCKIPDLQPMYEAVRDYVKTHQGDKGYIEIDDFSMYAMLYQSCGEYLESPIQKLRVENNDLQALTRDADWDSVRYGDLIWFTPTIFSIAEEMDGVYEI